MLQRSGILQCPAFQGQTLKERLDSSITDISVSLIIVN